MKKREQQQKLSRAWPKKYVKQLKMSYGNIDYVEHTQVTQKLIAFVDELQINVDPKGYIYDEVEDQHGIRRKFLTGVTVQVSGIIDGKFRTVSEVGMCDKPFFVEGGKKVSNNGERAKECISDGIKRCGMRIGIGLELWDTEVWLNDYLQDKPATAKSKPKTTNNNDQLKQNKEKLDKIIKETKKDIDKEITTSS
tara:strand:- start:4549 stop:5133 length:585 start_codon:yes stop_codon:yes gene_type:complete